MSSSVDSAGGKPQRDSDANGWWNDPHHPPYDGSPDELEVWYGCTLSTLPEYGSIEFAHMLRYGVHPATAAIMAVGAAAGPVVQWRYARAAVVKPRRLLTALSCLPALCAGLTATGAGSPVMYYFDACRARQPPRVSLTARDELTDADKWLYCYQAVEVHRGERPWPLPLRATNPRQADQQTVPAWVDKPPPDVESTWSEGRMEWKRRMAEEWGYTAEDVAVRDKVKRTAVWLYLLHESAGVMLYGAAAWSWQRLQPPTSRLLFGTMVSVCIFPFFGVTWARLPPFQKMERWYNDRLVRQLDPVSSAYRRVYFAPHYYSAE